MGFLDFKNLRSKVRVKSKIQYLLTNLDLKVFCKNINNETHIDYSRTSGKLTESDEEFEKEMRGDIPDSEFDLETNFNETL